MERDTEANDKQVGGDHYKAPIQHWDFVASNNLDYFQGQITKYVTRWKNKNGYQDLEKALHFLQKYMELNKPVPTGPERMKWVSPEESLAKRVAQAQAAAGRVQNIKPTPTPFSEAIDRAAAISAMKGAYLTRGERISQYTDYVFEGAQGEKELFTCKKCGTKVWTPKGIDPFYEHGECAGVPRE